MATCSDNIFTCFKERVVLITGAGGTLGSDAALLFVKYGAKLVLIDNHQARLDALNLQLSEMGHPQQKVVSMLGDVTSVQDVKTVIEKAILKFGQINHLVNIVGVKRMGTLEATTHDALEENFIDVRATFNVTKACLPHLEASKGSVVNISSVAGLIGYAFAVPYGTAKAALNHMTKIFAADFAKKGIRINAICPCSVYSDFQVRNGTFKTHEENDAYFKVAGDAIPMGRVAVGTAEVTQTILFLCSDAASFITGAILPIDGGYTLCAKAN